MTINKTPIRGALRIEKDFAWDAPDKTTQDEPKKNTGPSTTAIEDTGD